jgi:tetratricopeptide (TPR) repeat protein
MKPVTKSGLTFWLILSVGFLTHAHAVTDAELEALEQQIQQQEAAQQDEEKKIIEIEAKRKAESEANKIRLIELEKRKNQEILEQNKLEENHVRELEEQRLLEEERRRKETEERLKADLEKKAQHDNHINKAQVYMENENYDQAIEEYELLLKSFPDDAIATNGIINAQELLNSCNEIVGKWQLSHGPSWVVNDDHTADGAWLIFSANGVWECLSARKREFIVSWPDFGWVDYFELSKDANTLKPMRSTIQKDISGSRIDDTKIKTDDIKMRL